MKWEMDIVGKLPTAPGQRVYMLAVTDYFTKWVEAEAYHQVRDREVKNFIWKNVICHFGVPKEIITDNRSQFISFDFQDFCKDWGIQLSFSTPRYPQTNGQAESTNKTVINIIKRRLEKAKGLWADELPGMLWAYRTTAKTSTGETPFSLAYGTEAVIPVECGIPSATTASTRSTSYVIKLTFALHSTSKKWPSTTTRTSGSGLSKSETGYYAESSRTPRKQEQAS